MKLYGLIGHPLSHSFSKKHFENKFKVEGIADCHYELFDIEQSAELNTILKRHPNLHGLNVTIPHKTAIMGQLDDLDELAQRIGAVNTIKIDQISKKLTGYNTDYHGFKQSIKPFLAKEHERALILGTGGASLAVKQVLDDLTIPYLLVSREPTGEHQLSYDDLNEYVIKHHQLIINTTPVGMHPNSAVSPSIPYELLTKNHFLYDLVYNPAETKFLAHGKEKGCLVLNGLSMLKLQAEKAWEIWNS